MTKNKAAFI